MPRLILESKLTLQEAIDRWRQGEAVWCVSLGGIGPAYEQAIQILLWEIVARWTGAIPLVVDPESKEYPSEYEDHAEKVAHGLDKVCGGFTGAQVGIAKATAFQFLVYGYQEMMEKAPLDRKIMVSKHAPSLWA